MAELLPEEDPPEVVVLPARAEVLLFNSITNY